MKWRLAGFVVVSAPPPPVLHLFEFEYGPGSSSADRGGGGSGLPITIRSRPSSAGVGVVVGHVNGNLKARARDVRFELKRTCCKSWLQVEYGSSQEGSSGPGAPEGPAVAPDGAPPAAGASKRAGSGKASSVAAEKGDLRPGDDTGAVFYDPSVANEGLV